MTDDRDQVPTITPAQMKRARPMTDVHSAKALSQFKRSGGRPKAAVTKTAVSIRLDPDVVAHFKADGPGWHTRINGVLRRAMKGKSSGAARRTGTAA